MVETGWDLMLQINIAFGVLYGLALAYLMRAMSIVFLNRLVKWLRGGLRE